MARFAAIVLSSMLLILGVTVYVSAHDCNSISPGNNRLVNPQFDGPSLTAINNWVEVDRGYFFRRIGARNSHDSFLVLEKRKRDTSRRYGAAQAVQLRQSRPQTIYYGAWVRTWGITGPVDDDFSLYLDIQQRNGQSKFGVTTPLPVGTNGWRWVGGQFTPNSRGEAINSVRLNILLRGNQHSGRAFIFAPFLVQGDNYASDDFGYCLHAPDRDQDYDEDWKDDDDFPNNGNNNNNGNWNNGNNNNNGQWNNGQNNNNNNGQWNNGQNNNNNGQWNNGQNNNNNGQWNNGQNNNGQWNNGQNNNGQWNNGQNNNNNGQWNNGQNPGSNGQWNNGQPQNGQNGQWNNGQGQPGQNFPFPQSN